MTRLFVCLLLIAGYLPAHFDLNTLAQPWVLETRQVCIPGHPTAFNPSLVEWDGLYLLSFRVRDPQAGRANKFGFIWLDAEMDIVGNPQIIDMQTLHPFCDSWAQDPRLLKVGDSLYMVYNNLVPSQGTSSPKMFVGRLEIEGGEVHVERISCILASDTVSPLRKEKNWVPFDYQGNLLLAYSLCPHRIFLPRLDSDFCETLACTTAAVKWQWGILRGGTPALRIGDRYLAFFHSVKDLITEQSDGQRMAHYFMGAYTFAAEPPFELLSASPSPIIASTFYNGPAYQTWKPLRVVFPCGLVVKEDHVWVAYGRQDHEIWLVKIDRSALMESLVPVATTEK